MRKSCRVPHAGNKKCGGSERDSSINVVSWRGGCGDSWSEVEPRHAGWIYKFLGLVGFWRKLLNPFSKTINKLCEIKHNTLHHHVEYARYAENLGGQDKTLFQPEQPRTAGSKGHITCAYVQGGTYGLGLATGTSYLSVEE